MQAAPSRAPGSSRCALAGVVLLPGKPQPAGSGQALHPSSAAINRTMSKVSALFLERSWEGSSEEAYLLVVLKFET